MQVPAYLKSQANRFNTAVSNAGLVGFDFTILITLLPVIGQLIAMCKKPVPPAPPNPEPNPTPAQAAAWQKAHETHYLATTAYTGKGLGYKPVSINTTARQLMRQKRKNGEPISFREAKLLAVPALDEE